MANTQPVNNNNNNDDAARNHGDAATTRLERLYYPLMDTSSSSSSSSSNGGDQCQGSVILYGNPQSSQMCFFCGGFPDNHTVWQPLAQRLVDNDNKQDNSHFCGVTCLAGFHDDDDDDDNNNKPRAGFTLPQMTQAFMTAMQTFRDASQNTDAEFTVILHDWGVVIGLMAMNEMLETQGTALPTRIILFDVLPKSRPDATSWPSKPVCQSWLAYGRELFLKGLYRLGLTTTFALSSWTIPWLTKIYLQTTVAIGRTFHLLPFPPMDWHVLEQRHAHGIYGLVATPALWYKCYPYYHAMRAAVGGQYHTVFRYAHVPLCRPVLYMYGADKDVQFHSPDTIAWLQAQPNCQVVQVANAGHWLFLQQPDVCYRHVKNFMEQKK